MDVEHHRTKTNGIQLHYITAGSGPNVLCLHGWPETHREYLRIIERLGHRYRFIAPDMRGFADSDKPYSGYEPKTIAADMLGLLDAEKAERFHILSHDLGGPPSVALAYMANGRAVSLATIETPFFGLNYPGYVDPQVAYWHLNMHMRMDISCFLIEGRELAYLRHFFRDFAYDPTAVTESEIDTYATQMRQPGNLRASLNHYGYIPQMAEQAKELTAQKLTIPMMAWGGSSSFGSHCIDSAKAIAETAQGGVIDDCGHWVFQERTDFICTELDNFWSKAALRRTALMATTSTAFKIKSVEHTGITVTSLRDALTFWVDVLGFKHLYTSHFPNDPFIENVVGVPGATITLAMVQGPGHLIELLEYTAPPDRNIMKPRSCDVGSIHVAFQVDNLDAIVDRVKQSGWNTVGAPQTVEEGDRTGLRLAYVRGPDGVTLEFLQPPPTARREPAMAAASATD